MLFASCSTGWLESELQTKSGSVSTFGRSLACSGWLDGELVYEDSWDGLLRFPLDLKINKITNNTISFIINIYTQRTTYCFPSNDSYWELSTSSFKIKGHTFDVFFDAPIQLSLRPISSPNVYCSVEAQVKGNIKSNVYTKSQPSMNRFAGDIVITWKDPDNPIKNHELHINQFSEGY